MAPAKKAAQTKKSSTTKRKPQQKYIRNLRHVPIAFRMGEDKRRIELKPRGQRGDLIPLKKGDQTDDTFLKNVDLLFEVISTSEVDKITENQTTNQTTKQHPAMAAIRNELGEEYEGNPVVVEEEFNSQGRVVANLDDSGNIPIDRGTGIRRASIPGSEDRPLPDVPDSIPPEEAADWVARNSDNPISSLRVSKEPTQR